MKKFSLLLLSVLFVFNVGFGQTGAPFLDIDWELVPTPITAVNGFAEKDGRLWLTNGQLYFSDDEGMTWEEHPEVLSGATSTYINVFTTDTRVIVVTRSSSGTGTLVSYDNGETFSTGNIGWSSTTEPDGSGYGGLLGFYQKSGNEIVSIYHQVDELLGENYKVVSSVDSSQSVQEYPHLEVGYVFTHEATLEKHFYSVQNDTIAELILNWNTTGVTKLALTQGVDTTFTEDLIMPDNFGNYNGLTRGFWYQSGKVYLYHQDSFIVASSDFGENWEIVPSPDGSQIGSNSYQFTDAGIYWNLADGLWVTRYDDWTNPAFIFEFNTARITTRNAGDYSLYSIGTSNYLKSPMISEPELRNNGLTGRVNYFNSFGQVWWADFGSGLLRSNDEGTTWVSEWSSNLIINDFGGYSFSNNFGNVIYLNKDGLIFYSVNGGSWNPVIFDYFSSAIRISKTDEEIYIYGRDFYGDDRLLYSNDGINFVDRVHPEGSLRFVTIEDNLYALNEQERFISTDKGLTWSPPEVVYGASDNFWPFHTGELWRLENNSMNEKGFIISSDAGKTWIEHQAMDSVLTASGQYEGLRLKTASEELIIMRGGEEAYATANLGGDWGKIPTPFADNAANVTLLLKNEYLYGYAGGRGLYRTSMDELLSQLSDTILLRNKLTGFLYKDQNNNCSFDQDDLPIPDKVITLGDRITTTDDQGWYGIFHTSTDSIDFYTDSVRYHVNNCEYANFGSKLLNVESEDTLSIAFNPIPGITDAGLSVWPSGVFRPSGNPRLLIRATNHGTAPINNQAINVIFDPVKQNIAASNDGILANDSTWQFSASLLAGEEKTFNLGVELSTDLTLNDTLFYQIAIPTTDDEYPADNLVALEIPVVSSFDPNDKIVFPANTPRPGETTELVYRIRFQNTGNDTAFNVTVIDTLSENLNLYSLKMLEVSHPYELQIDEGNIVRWNFNNILLPDSTTNEPESHGFIYFKIETKDQVVHGDQIENLAAIYFDFNEPIITNTVVTDIVDILISTEDLSTLPFITKLQPNPTNHAATLIFELEKPEKLTIDLYNELGQNIKSVLIPQIMTAGTHKIEVSLLSVPSGIYFLNIKTETGVKTVRVVKME